MTPALNKASNSETLRSYLAKTTTPHPKKPRKQLNYSATGNQCHQPLAKQLTGGQALHPLSGVATEWGTQTKQKIHILF